MPQRCTFQEGVGGGGSAVRDITRPRLDSFPHFKTSGLKITDSRSPVTMTGQIFFSPDKLRFWPVKLMNTIIIFLPMELRWQ